MSRDHKIKSKVEPIKVLKGTHMMTEDTFTALMNQFKNQLINELAKSFEDIVIAKIIEKGYGHYLNQNPNARFSRIIDVVQGDYNRIYVDDGTDDGLLVVTLLLEKPELTFGTQEFTKMKYTIVDE